jgi:serine phosphatase RsbU (regulator of sigma subunit)/PAS domain-containing protein
VAVSSNAGRADGPYPLDAALDEALSATVRRTGAATGGIYLVEGGEPVLRLVAMCGLPIEFAAPWRRLPLTAPVPISDSIAEERLIWVGSQEEMARRYPRAAAALPYRFALAAAPLTGVRCCSGALLLLWAGNHKPDITRRERGTILFSARSIARLLDEAPRPPRMPDQPRMVPVGGSSSATSPRLAAADYLERLPEGALSLDLEGRITFLSGTAARLLGRSAQQLLGTRPWQALPWLDDPVYEDHYRTAVISREPVSYTALRPPDRWLTFDLYPDTSGISVRIVPGRGQPEAAPVPLRRAAQPSTGRLYQLVHLAAALSETVGVRDLVDLIADQILPAFSAQGLCLSAADAGRLKIIGYHGYSAESMERLDGLPLDTTLTPAGQVLASGTPSFFPHPADMARLYPAAPQVSGKQAWAFLPLIVSGRPVGCCILSYDKPHDFSADERAVMTSLAGLLAQALDRARLYDTKHQLAHGLQAALLPRSLPSVPGLEVAARYLPASRGLEVGGDFYDLIRLDGSTAAAVIGDVQGHNIAAAAFMGQVRAAVHAHAAAGAAPDEVLARTNRVLADLEPDLLVTCLYAHLDLDRHQVTAATSGHVPPLLRRPGEAARALEVDPGPPLGVDAAARFPCSTAPLPESSVLTLYTDGLVEIPGHDSDRSTAELLRQLDEGDGLPLEPLIDALVHRSWPTARYTDDIAVLALRATR